MVATFKDLIEGIRNRRIDDPAQALADLLGPADFTFSGPAVFTFSRTDAAATIELRAAVPGLRFNETDAAANNTRWDIYSTTGDLVFSPLLDNGTGSGVFALRLDRTGNVVNAVRIPLDTTEFTLGAGNDLRLFHDGTNSIIGNNTGALHIDSAANTYFLNNNEVTIGHTSGWLGGLDVLGTDQQTDARIGLSIFSADTNGAEFIFSKSRGTLGSHGAVLNGDVLGVIRVFGSNGTTIDEGARIAFVVDNTPGTGDLPTRIGFYMSPDGSAVVVRKWLMRPNGEFHNLLDGSLTTNNISLGLSEDLTFFHDGTNSHIDNTTGNLVLTVAGELDLEEVTTSTGSVTTTLGANAPAGVGTTTPTTWMTLIVNGTTYFIPLWT